MSRNSGASGTIYLPKSAYGKIVKNLMAKHLELSIPEYEKINALIEKTTINMKGKRNVNWYDALCHTLDETHLKDSSGHYTKKLPFSVVDPYNAFYKAAKDNTKPKKVKPETFKSTADRISFDFASESSITMDKEKCALHLHISYNNHNLEEATASPFYKAVLSAMRQIEWTSKTGGTVYMTQEEDENFYHSHSSSHKLFSFGNPDATYTPAKPVKPKP